jgi:exosome complex RNA-binding protein Rrp42 (RNase PH superfamily)
LGDGLRIDGRTPYDYRDIGFEFTRDDSSCMLSLGQTRVYASIEAKLGLPFSERPSEGSVRFQVEFSPSACSAFQGGRPGDDAIELARLIERGIRDSKAIDREALCVLQGRKVWHINVVLTVVDFNGNATDACGLAALAVLSVYRRPDVTLGASAVAGSNEPLITVHSREEKEPVPLTLHHLPLSVTFAFFDDGTSIAVDPNLKEEEASSGRITIVVNAQNEICAIQKSVGSGITQDQTLRCIRIATGRVSDRLDRLKQALEDHAAARVAFRVRRQYREGDTY